VPADTDSTFSVYMIRCANGDLYTGIARDVLRRLDEHARGNRGARFLRGKGPLTLVFTAVVGDRSAATRIEYLLKRMARSRKEALAAGRTTLAELLPGLDPARDQASGDERG
jgi:putative endonuclease